MLKSIRALMFFAAVVVFNSSNVLAAVVFTQGFETSTSGWFDGSGYGTITQAPSGTGGITASSGSYYGLVTGTDSGPYTKFDGYKSVWTGPFSASVDIYLDTSWESGFGFDYSVAASRANGSHLRDYIFHVAKDTSTGDLSIGGSNNSNFSTREDLENINHYTAENSGWYTFEHSFYESSGSLYVDLNLYANGSLLWTETRNAVTDLVPSVVGGNRYGWFTFVGSASSIAIDNVQLTATTPEPGTMLLMGIGAAGVVFIRRRKGQRIS